MPLIFAFMLTWMRILTALPDAEAAAYVYTVIDGPPGSASTTANAINNSGIILGWSDNGYFLYCDGSYTPVSGPPGWTPVDITGINDSGAVVGWGETGSPGASIRTFLFSGGTYTTIDPPPGPPGLGQFVGFGINDSGHIVGTGQIGPTYFPPIGLLNIAGIYTPIAPPGWGYVTATGINDSGEIVGYGTVGSTRANFLYAGGIYTTIAPPPGWGSVMTVTGINNIGAIVGYGASPSQGAGGFVYRDGIYSTINPPGWIGVQANGINNHGVVVGSGADGSGITRGFVATPAGVIDDLAGTWYFQVLADKPSANAPYWASGNMTLDAMGNVIGGMALNDQNVTKTLTGGAFTIDGAGQASGYVTLSDGTMESLPHGKLEAGKKFLAMVNSDVDYRGLFLATKAGGTFAQDDLAGTWHFQVLADFTSENNPFWGSGTMIVDATGAVTGGMAINSLSQTDTITGGSFTIDSEGKVSGSVQQSGGITQDLPYGKLDAGKSILTMVNSALEIRGLFVAVKAGGTFTQEDLAGTWYFQVLADNPSANAPYWASGNMTLDAMGNVIGGAAVNDQNVTKTLTGGAFTIDGAGQASGYVTLSDGTMESLPHGKLEAGKTILSLVNSDLDFRGLFVAIKGPPPLVARFNAEPVQGMAPLMVNFEDTSSGVIATYLWNFGDGATSIEQHPTHIYQSAGTYTVSLTVTGDVGTNSCTKTSLIHANALPKVAIRATDPKASEPGTDKGKFVISRTGDTTKPLTVYYKVSGTATNGIDYKKLSGKLVIPIGKASANLYVKPMNDNAKERKEAVKVTLIKKTTYSVGTPASAAVTIADND
jgi:PKD repeat protein